MQTQKMKNKERTGIFLAVLAAALYAINSPFSKLLLDYVPSTLMAGFLYIGAGLGMGDVKLMFGAGLLLGGGRMLLAMFLGSLAGSVIHTIRMKRGAGKKLAFGPYLAFGIWTSALFGAKFIDFYLGLFGL